MHSALELIEPSKDGLWRIGRASSPIFWQRPEQSSGPGSSAGPDGGRFDSYFGTYAVSYFATTRYAACLECLAPLRSNEVSRERVREDWAKMGNMNPGSIPADWRHKRLYVRALPAPYSLPFVDITHNRTLAWLASNKKLSQMLELAQLPVHADLSTVVGENRAVTRMISQILYDEVNEKQEYQYAGIRYLSRYGSNLECWAIFEGTELAEAERRPLDVHDTDLTDAARDFGLIIH